MRAVPLVAIAVATAPGCQLSVMSSAGPRSDLTTVTQSRFTFHSNPATSCNELSLPWLQMVLLAPRAVELEAVALRSSAAAKVRSRVRAT